MLGWWWGGAMGGRWRGMGKVHGPAAKSQRARCPRPSTGSACALTRRLPRRFALASGRLRLTSLLRHACLSRSRACACRRLGRVWPGVCGGAEQRRRVCRHGQRGLHGARVGLGRGQVRARAAGAHGLVSWGRWWRAVGRGPGRGQVRARVCGPWVAARRAGWQRRSVTRAEATLDVLLIARAGLAPVARRVVAVRFIGDTTRVITASHDQTARVWDSVRGLCLHVLTGHTGASPRAGCGCCRPSALMLDLARLCAPCSPATRVRRRARAVGGTGRAAPLFRPRSIVQTAVVPEGRCLGQLAVARGRAPLS